MDFPVEATVHLNNFQDEAEVRRILRSHGFEVADLGRGQVRVKGSFLQLKAVKARLEPLAQSQTKTPYSSSLASSGAIPKYHNNSNDRGRSQSRHRPLSPSSPTTSSSYASGPSHSGPTSQSYRPSSPDQQASPRPGTESFVIDADVFRYADQLRKKDIENILNCHNVGITVQEGGDSANISVTGRSASKAVGKLQSLLDDLSRSLRTQEVPLRDMNHDGNALLERIRKNRHIHSSVLVREMSDSLHLVGPSSESFELKQRLLGRPFDPSGRRGRTSDKSSRERSFSLPPRNTDTDGGARPSPAGAAGYSPSKYKEDEDEQEQPAQGAAALHGRGRSSRGRSQSESRAKKGAERAHGSAQEKEDQHLPPKSPLKKTKQFLMNNLSPKNITQKLRNRKK